MSHDTVGHLLFGHACDGLVDAVRKASEPPSNLRTLWGDVWSPYYGDVVSTAVWQAQHCYREARRLGLLESEPIDVSVLINLDVEAGELTE